MIQCRNTRRTPRGVVEAGLPFGGPFSSGKVLCSVSPSPGQSLVFRPVRDCSYVQHLPVVQHGSLGWKSSQTQPSGDVTCFPRRDFEEGCRVSAALAVPTACPLREVLERQSKAAQGEGCFLRGEAGEMVLLEREANENVHWHLDLIFIVRKEKKGGTPKFYFNISSGGVGPFFYWCLSLPTVERDVNTINPSPRSELTPHNSCCPPAVAGQGEDGDGSQAGTGVGMRKSVLGCWLPQQNFLQRVH